MNKNVKTSVYELRKTGNKVRVTHSRNYQVFNVKTGKINTRMLTKYQRQFEGEAQRAISPAVVFGPPEPKGGYTKVEITFADGSVVFGESFCHENDNFKHKDGVKYALANAQSVLDSVTSKSSEVPF